MVKTEKKSSKNISGYKEKAEKDKVVDTVVIKPAVKANINGEPYVKEN